MEVKQRIQTLVAAPQHVADQDIAALKAVIEQYPYFEPLHVLMAKAQPENPAVLSAAALRVDGAVLHDLLQQPSIIEPVLYEEEEVFEEIHELDVNAILHPVAEAPTAANTSLERQMQPDSIHEPQRLSNYNDDTLPYTFLWWLAKTRKEHQTAVQPYATPKKNTPGELQQQYVEHIFHIQSPFNAEEVIHNTPKSKHIDPKETAIIDSFLKKDPQISPPKPEQIDNENKAKKSAEDHNDLVSETLAKIYIEQMLYHKAIDTYEKLSLKFPEKSRYFADLIQSLEKKI